MGLTSLVAPDGELMCQCDAGQIWKMVFGLTVNASSGPKVEVAGRQRHDQLAAAVAIEEALEKLMIGLFDTYT